MNRPSSLQHKFPDRVLSVKSEHTEGRTAARVAISNGRLSHLQRLEAESIHIFREVVAEADNPVMLYSIGKDSATMLHLARKAFFPAALPFPLLHVDTTWKFREMYAACNYWSTRIPRPPRVASIRLITAHNYTRTSGRRRD